jgi:hypothetical protein
MKPVTPFWCVRVKAVPAAPLRCETGSPGVPVLLAQRLLY